jgi:DNA-binding transcriptional MerR regulator
MNLFSISQISQFSGIKPHTIRMWEKRYNALTPNRSTGNTRYYDNSQLRRLLNIVSLSECGYKLADICAMTDKKLFALVDEINKNTSENESADYFVSQLIGAGMGFNEELFEKIFSHCLIRFGLKDAYIKVIYPMLSRIGILWTTDHLVAAHEHFVSNLLRQKLFTAINSLPPPTSSPDTWLLFLPENEFHEIGLLLANYLIRLSGRQVIYLGTNVPIQSITIAVQQTKPDNLLLFIVHNDLPEDLNNYCNQLVKIFNGQIYLAANEKLITHLKIYKKIQLLQNISALEQKIFYV